MKMVRLALPVIISTVFCSGINAFAHSWPLSSRDSFPKVLNAHHADLIASRLRNEAYLRYAEHSLPVTRMEWEKMKNDIRNQIIRKNGIVIDHRLPLNYKETGVIEMDRYTIRKIMFQTRPGVYAIANLYVPKSGGPFPAVVNMHGHWREGRMAEPIQYVSQALVLNGYVCLSIDAFGAGERSSIHGEYEYHGSNLGASLMNVGETLLGFQASDNMRAVDLLCSLPFVDSSKIGATGASGGGNQTMWLTAMDERIKASMPVVSVGTFESYILNDNCICELPVDALNFTEEAGVLAMVAPRALKISTHTKEEIPAFFPEQMLRSYKNAKAIYTMLRADKKISYELFNSDHGYWKEDREAMLGWFDLHLKGIGDGSPVKEPPFEALKDSQLMVFPKGQKDPRVENISTYCKRTGNQLRQQHLLNQSIDPKLKRDELKSMLRISAKPSIKKVFDYGDEKGWSKVALKTNADKMIPLLLKPSKSKSNFVIICNPAGKNVISDELINDWEEKGFGIVMVDLEGTGEAASPSADSVDGQFYFHTLSRTHLLLGKTTLGEWVNELDVINQFINSKFGAVKIVVDGTKEAALAALFFSAIHQNTDIVLRNAPVSYVFDRREEVDYYTMAVHLPGFLKWGDISLAAALTNKNVVFVNPLTMSGNKLSDTKNKELLNEFDKMRKISGHKGRTVFE